MKTIMTVLGPVSSAKLGHCQLHEHIFVLPTPNSRKYPALEISDEAKSLAELIAYRAAGGGAILDAQPLDAGRDIASLARLSRDSGVHIIAVTGYHLPAFYEADHWIHTEGVDALFERFYGELTQGVRCDGGEVIYPGAVKSAIGGDGPVGQMAVCLRAAARAAARADVPLIMHTEKGAGALDAIRICGEEGLRRSRIAVCHVDRQAADWAPHDAIAATGVFMEYDTIARTKYHDDESERALIGHMLDAGYANRLLISLDTTAARLKSYGDPSACGLDFILRSFIPALRTMGLSEADIENLTVKNPVRIFE